MNHDEKDSYEQKHAEGISSLESKLDYLRKETLGYYSQFVSPFDGKWNDAESSDKGNNNYTKKKQKRRILYCDWTASGRNLSCIEDCIKNYVMPSYGNTHTSSSLAGIQTTMLRKEARNYVHSQLHCRKSDSVLFVGNGATECINKFINMIKLRDLCEKYSVHIVLGCYEHHSNLLPWKEMEIYGCKIRMIPESTELEKGIDLKQLDQTLKDIFSSQSNPSQKDVLIIGSFSAASNITGIIQPNIDKICDLIHKYKGICAFDYSGSAPYLSINMMDGMDCIYFSGHKFLGGVGSCGVLVINQAIFNRFDLLKLPPSTPGGGTVFFVTPEHHVYLQDVEEREQGGTPNVIASLRCALALQVKNEWVGISNIETIEQTYLNIFLSQMKPFIDKKKIYFLGYDSNDTLNATKRLPILSFLIPCNNFDTTGESNDKKRVYFYHYNYICLLLNDLFGIQSRGGCACAGPYALRLLGMSDPISCLELEEELFKKQEILRPGFTRINLHYLLTRRELQYIIDCIIFVIEHALQLLPLYQYHVDSGHFCHRNCFKTPILDKKSLSHIQLVEHDEQWRLEWPTPGDDTWDEQEMDDYLKEAKSIVDNLKYPPFISDDSSLLQNSRRWFILPSEALNTPIDGNISTKTNTTTNTITSTNKDQGENIEEKKKDISDANNRTLVNFPLSFSWLRLSLIKTINLQTHHIFWIVFALAIVTRWNETNPNFFLMLATTNAFTAIFVYFFFGSLINQTQQTTKVQNDNVNLWGKYEHDDYTKQCNNCNHYHQKNKKECLHCQCVDYKPWNGYNDNEKNNKHDSISNDSANNRQKLIKKLSHDIGKAIKDYNMIKNNDRVLVALSGGKDSLTLLYILRHLQKKAPIEFEVAACTIDPQHPQFDPSYLKTFFNENKSADNLLKDIKYHYINEPIMELAKEHMDEKKKSFCSFCSRMKRGLLYEVCRTHGYNVLAMGQHLDDLCESFLMSAFFNGQVQTMKANYYCQDGDVRIIRPMIYVREHCTREFSKAFHLPVIDENCPACFDSPKERQRCKQILAAQEHLHPTLFPNLLKAITPLLGAQNSFNAQNSKTRNKKKLRKSEESTE
ncbi:hypothetical protein RFI_00557 [Reticulomyxa filosa]|uniref:Aminotransferase class V domain-containing protein n=1 Tax=Reticulomyxa filosa TaxID=46433 RepID=X6PFP3_RETFI|nr:hypothetical protein RFI_00557 [Reticulomyxa filosa]|eukprot:ETO36502.1 hypothetical protein RFI_00557 [Reticulomyxa filosa]